MKWIILVAITSAFLIQMVQSRGDDKNFQCWHRFYRFSHSNMFACSSDHRCTCNNITVDCSSQNLTFVPIVGLESYRYLNLSNNRLRSIPDDRFFSNVSRDVEEIDLFSNGLRYLSAAAFRGLYRLRMLYLGGLNYLTYRDLPTLLSVQGGVSLDLGCLRLGAIPSDAFREARKSKTNQLGFSWNQIPSLNMSVFQPLRHIQYLKFWHNEIYDLQTAFLPSLDQLGLEANRLFDFPRTCSSSGSLFPRLTRLRLDQNMIDCIADPVCLPSLTFLSLSYNRILSFPSNMFSMARFPSLTGLKLMQMEGKIRKIQPFFVNNSKVTYVTFHLNQVDFSKSDIDEDAFGGCPNLWRLGLRGNTFGGVSDSKFRRLLSPMKYSLGILDLGQAQMEKISDQTFSGLENLTVLSLYGNAFTSVPDGAFDQLPRLTYLQIDHNSITTISKTTFSPQLRKRLKTLTLSANPFQCDCNILWFQSWMKANPLIFIDYHTRAGYPCNNMNNLTLPNFVLNEQACMLGSDAAAFTISITCVFILFFILFSLFFRFRWHVRLWLYEACRTRQHRRLLRERRRYRYDLFVSYAEENMDWVDHQLIPILEGQWGLRLCVHQRDFVPGKHIVDNISDCVEDSERILLVFSPSFARSEWCQFELKFCQTCVMERDDVLVIVALQTVGSRDMTGAMMAVLRTTTYVEWEDEEEQHPMFWERLRLTLEDSEGLV
ncbi:toll-like receptor 2 type-2 isoform X2 [Babylonia areolata]|uniref:toll-like receptor 2 type-2 isoform X2 n=1 Tax=Babylonia areolata TaxID=304850 RepID=UPI003FD28BE0